MIEEDRAARRADLVERWQRRARAFRARAAELDAARRFTEEARELRRAEEIETCAAELLEVAGEAARSDTAQLAWCSGCGARWQTPEGFLLLGVVRLCGDCWRKVQRVLHAPSGDDASREAARRMSVRGPSPIVLEPFKALARTHRHPRDRFTEQLTDALWQLIGEIERLQSPTREELRDAHE